MTTGKSILLVRVILFDKFAGLVWLMAHQRIYNHKTMTSLCQQKNLFNLPLLFTFAR